MISTKLLMLAFFSGGEAAQGGPLDVNPGLILWTVVTFLFLLFILAKVAWKPILKSLSDRESFIKESLDKAILRVKMPKKCLLITKQVF
jgi:F-type H+-transporting ATPase subunit b